MTIVEKTSSVVGGVDTHADVHVAAVVDHLGGVLGIETFDTTESGYHQLVRWFRSHGSVRLVGVEGTGSYGAGLARHLTRAEIELVEVDRPNRQARYRDGKSDPLDAVAAARAALSGVALGRPKSRDGNVEAIRVLTVVRRSAVSERIVTLNQLRHLCFTADPVIRRRFEGLSVAQLTKTAAALKPRPGDDQVRYSTLFAIRALGRRVVYLRDEVEELTALVKPLIDQRAPGLMGVYGVGYEVAAKLLIAAGDNPDRLTSEQAFAHMCGTAPLQASSGKTQRHRLNRGGNREANNALWRIVMVRMSHDPRTRDYVERRTQQGKTKKAIMRCLKRYVVREVFNSMHLRTCLT